MNNSSGAERGRHPYMIPIRWIALAMELMERYPHQSNRYLKSIAEAQKEIERMKK